MVNCCGSTLHQTGRRRLPQMENSLVDNVRVGLLCLWPSPHGSRPETGANAASWLGTLYESRLQIVLHDNVLSTGFGVNELAVNIKLNLQELAAAAQDGAHVFSRGG